MDRRPSFTGCLIAVRVVTRVMQDGDAHPPILVHCTAKPGLEEEYGCGVQELVGLGGKGAGVWAFVCECVCAQKGTDQRLKPLTVWMPHLRGEPAGGGRLGVV